MRFAINKVIFLGACFCSSAFGLDLSKYEEQCSDIGFAAKTPAFGECVLELRSRDRSRVSSSNVGDNSPDHVTCNKYGFTNGTAEYAQCRMQIDLARNQAAEHRRQNEEQLAAQQRAKDRAKGQALFLTGLGMMAGPQRPPAAGFNTFQPPQPINRIYNLPGGQFMTCNTSGMVTNCQ